MLSDPVEDEDRFREIIEEAIKNKIVEEYAVFRKETKTSKASRMRKAREEEKEAAQAAKRLGADKLLNGSSGDGSEKGKKSKKKVSGHMDDLASIIQARQASRMGGTFLDNLAAKYGGRKSGNPGGSAELDEEEFQRIQSGLGKSKSKGKGKAKKREADSEDDSEVDEKPAPKKKLSRGKKSQPKAEEEDEDEVADEDVEMDEFGDDQAEEVEEEEEEEEIEVEKPAPQKRARKPSTRQSKRVKKI